MATKKKMLQAAAGNAGGGGYWITEITNDIETPILSGVVVDSNGNATALDVIGATPRKFYLIQVNSSGDVNWSKTYNLAGTDSAATTHYTTKLAVDDSDNIYFSSEVSESSPTYITDWHIGKVSSEGAYVDCEVLYGSTYERPKGVWFNGTNIVSYGNNDANIATIVEVDTSLNVLNNYKYTETYFYQMFDLSQDGSSNYYTAVNMDGSSNFPAAYMKLNSSFEEQFTVKLDETVTAVGAVGIGGELYGLGYYTPSGNGKGVLLKANSAGVVQYQKTIEGESGSLFRPRALRNLSDGSIVITALYRASGETKTVTFVGVVDPSTPSFVSQQIIEHTTDSLDPRGIHISEGDDITITAANRIFKVPSDGLVTGTYGDYTVSDASVYFSAGTITEVSLSPTRGNNSWSSRGTTYSTSDLGYTESLQDL